MRQLTGLILMIFLFACSSEDDKKTKESNWSPYAKNTFMEKCVSQAKIKVDSTKAVDICNCVMGKLIEAYPDTSKIDKDKIAKESTSMILKCLF
jgi:hypothetical protein